MYIYWRFLLSLLIFSSSCAILAGLGSGGREDSFTDCMTPDAILDAQLLSDNGSFSVNFSWTFENDNSTICHHIFSVRSYQSSVPYNLEDKTEPINVGPVYQRYTQVDQQTYHIFADIDRTSYHQFELRIQANLFTTSVRVYRHFSFLYYFGDQVPAKVVEPASDDTVIRAYLGHSVTLPCSGTGVPNPSSIVLRDPHMIPPPCDYCTFIGAPFSYIAPVREYHSGEHFCVISNILVNPPHGKRRIKDWKRMELIVEPAPANISYGRCLSYIPNECGEFLDHDLLVFFDLSYAFDHNRQLNIQAQILFKKIDRRANRSELSSLDPALKNRCQRLAQSIACHSVYPYCDPSHDVPTPRLICKTSCDAFSAGGICERFISEAETPELYSRLAAKCDTREHPAGSSPECVPIDMETAQIGHNGSVEQSHSWCTRGNERSYPGNIHRTRSGLDCQPWASQVPHKHPFRPSKYSSELSTETHIGACRNPGGVGEGPWCYTNDSNIRWEYCEVPQCVVCQRYEGYEFCHDVDGYIHENWTVYVDRSHYEWETLALDSIDLYLKNLLAQITADIGDDVWTPGCDHKVRQLLCHAMLPFCKKQESTAPLMACNGCQLLDVIQFCSTEVYRRLVQVLREEHSKFYFQPDECLTRTAAGHNLSSTSPDCMPSPQGLQPSGMEDCYSSSDHGQSYTGQLATTQRGEHCQSWNEPHLLFHPGFYPELDGAANLCRNPGQLKDKIWCFTSESSWDYCPIPTNCTMTPVSFQTDNHWTVLTVLAILVATCTFIVGITSYFLVDIGRKYFKKQTNSKSTSTSQTV